MPAFFCMAGTAVGTPRSCCRMRICGSACKGLPNMFMIPFACARKCLLHDFWDRSGIVTVPHIWSLLVGKCSGTVMLVMCGLILVNDMSLCTYINDMYLSVHYDMSLSVHMLCKITVQGTRCSRSKQHQSQLMVDKSTKTCTCTSISA